MHCAIPLSKLLFSSPMANLSEAFPHAYLKLSFLGHERAAAGGSFYVHLHPRFKLQRMICALTNVDSEWLAPISSSESQTGADLYFGASHDLQDLDVDEKEKLRRSRISRANKGCTPWNKGKKHSPETVQRIRERTRIAMQNHEIKIKLKLMRSGSTHSDETKSKIGDGVKESWRRRRSTKMIQVIVKDLNVGESQDPSQKDLNWQPKKLIQDQMRDLNVGEFEDVSEKELNPDEKEKLRRLRISKANKSKVPWNKGKKHSAETLQRIRERTKIAMQSPKLKEQLKEYYTHRSQKIIIQKERLIEWNNMVAEAARIGLYGDEELRWDLYE